MSKTTETPEAALLRATRERELRDALDEALDGVADEQTLFARTCRLLVERAGHTVAWVGKAEHDERRTVRAIAFTGLAAEEILTNDVVWSASERGSGPTGTAIRTRVPCLMERVVADARVTPWREAAARLGVTVALSLPLVVDDEVFGALTIYSRAPSSFEADEVALLVSLVRRVTEAAAELRERARRDAAALPTEQRFQRIFHATQALIALISPAGVIREINETTLRRAQLTAREVIGTAFAELSYQWESEREIRAAIDRCVRSAARVRVELDVELDGSPAALDVVFEPLRGERGEVEAIVVEAWDVTERRRAERELSAREQELRLIAENIHDVLWIVDPMSARLVYASPAYESVFGRPIPRADARPRDLLAVFHEDDLEEVRLAFTKCAILQQEVDIACRIVRPDGEVRHVRATARPVLDAAGSVVRVAGVLREAAEPSPLQTDAAALRRVS